MDSKKMFQVWVESDAMDKFEHIAAATQLSRPVLARAMINSLIKNYENGNGKINLLQRTDISDILSDMKKRP